MQDLTPILAHVMAHPQYQDILSVGCVCAEKMSGDYVNHRARETKLKNRAARRSRWLPRKWRVARSGKDYLNIEGYNLGVFPDKHKPEKWKYWIAAPHLPNRIFSKKSFITDDEAKLAAFDEFWLLSQGET